MPSILLIAMLQWTAAVTNYFRRHDATTLEKAIPFDYQEFIKTSKFYMLPPEKGLLHQPYIKTNTKGNYYLDEDALKNYSTKWKRISLIILLASALFLVIAFILTR